MAGIVASMGDFGWLQLHRVHVRDMSPTHDPYRVTSGFYFRVTIMPCNQEWSAFWKFSWMVGNPDAHVNFRMLCLHADGSDRKKEREFPNVPLSLINKIT